LGNEMFSPAFSNHGIRIRPHEEAYDAAIAGIFIALMVVVALLLLFLPS
jgi:hypothetical protein